MVTAAGRPRLVLVAHDDPPMRHLIVAVLRVAGHSVEVCAEPYDLVARIPDAAAVVVDGRLGGRHPDEVVAMCNWLAPAVPRVLICGAREEVSRMRTPPGRRLTVLSAPFAPLDIVWALDRVTEDAIPA